MSTFERKRLSVSEVQRVYGVSRATIERLIARGDLVPQRLCGSGKRWFHPAEVDALFQSPAPVAPRVDLKAWADHVYFQTFGMWPKVRRSSH